MTMTSDIPITESTKTVLHDILPFAVNDVVFYGILLYTVVLMVATIIGNGTVVYVIISKRSLWTGMNTLVGFLALADLSAGTVSHSLRIVIQYGLPANPYGCLGAVFLTACPATVSVLLLTCIAIERVAAVLFPIYHLNHFRSRPMCIVATVCWITGILLHLIPLGTTNSFPAWDQRAGCFYTAVVDQRYRLYIIFLGFIVPCYLILVLSYGYLTWKLTKYSKVESNRTTDTKRDPSHTNSESSITNRKRNIKAAKVLAFVVVTRAICMFPMEIVIGIEEWAGLECLVCKILGAQTLYITSMFNPILYVKGNSALKAGVRDLIKSVGLMRTRSISDEGSGSLETRRTNHS